MPRHCFSSPPPALADPAPALLPRPAPDRRVRDPGEERTFLSAWLRPVLMRRCT